MNWSSGRPLGSIAPIGATEARLASVFGRIWPLLAAFATHSEPSAMRQSLLVKELTSTGVAVQDVDGVSFFARSVRLKPLDLVDEL